MNKSLNKLGLSRVYEEVPIQVGKICSALDIKASQIDLPEDISGLIRLDNNHCYIEINKEHHPHRKRFTIAHELGHYLLHKDVLDENGEILERSDKVHDEKELQMEREANEFAAELLIPEYKIKELFKDIKMISKLAEYFFVSEIALECRLINLGLIHGGL